ncbi:hypothetical protein Tco_0908355 [Tanacetum coccineum]|uniref:Uncharacterized protein n=1 Tax=Tanacetum coccineum TaxID=301880 RepID=A0ABQ5CLW9_9ASTR
MRVHTPSHYESTNDEDSDEEIQGVDVEEEEMDEEETNEEDKANELYRDVNVNLEGRDTEMTDAPRTIIQPTQVIEDTHVIITPVNPAGQQQSSSVSSGLPVSLILGIVDAYLANKMHEAVKIAVQLQSDRLRDEAQAENADFINKLDDNIKKIIKDQVKEQVKAQSSKILPKIEEDSPVDAYESDKLILDTYEDTVSFKRRRDDEDKDEEPSVRSNRGSKRRRAGKEPESTSAPKEKTSKSTEGSKLHHKSAGESAQAEEPMHIAKDLEEPAHQEFKIGVTEDQPNEETS